MYNASRAGIPTIKKVKTINALFSVTYIYFHILLKFNSFIFNHLHVFSKIIFVRMYFEYLKNYFCIRILFYTTNKQLKNKQQ